MLRTLRARIERWPLAKPFRISRGLKTTAEIVTVELSEGYVSGCGEAAPYLRYGETPESVYAQILAVAPQIAAGASRQDLIGMLPAGAARNAVDCAMWDLEARIEGALPEGLDIHPPEPLAIAMTLSLDRPAAMGEAAKAAVAGGAQLLKAKLDGTEPDDCLRAIRAAAPGLALIVDANEGWNIGDLQRLDLLLGELRVAFVEQPLPAEQDWLLDGLQLSVPLCADESCHTSADLERLAGRYSMVNVKLDKAGGLTEALRLVEAARASGFGVMTGCMICTSLAIAPAFRVAALADYVDLDGPLWLSKDRDGGVRMGDDGRLAPPEPALWGGPWMTRLLRT